MSGTADDNPELQAPEQVTMQMSEYNGCEVQTEGSSSYLSKCMWYRVTTVLAIEYKYRICVESRGNIIAYHV